MSLIFDGVFDRFPTLRIVFVEHAFTWILPLMWRMDAIYAARKQWMDIKRKPSEYVKDHIKFTTQPLDYPEDKTELMRAFEWMECDKILLYCLGLPALDLRRPPLAGQAPTRTRPREHHVPQRHSDLPPARHRPGTRRTGPGVLSSARRQAETARDDVALDLRGAAGDGAGEAAEVALDPAGRQVVQVVGRIRRRGGRMPQTVDTRRMTAPARRRRARPRSRAPSAPRSPSCRPRRGRPARRPPSPAAAAPDGPSAAWRSGRGPARSAGRKSSTRLCSRSANCIHIMVRSWPSAPLATRQPPLSGPTRFSLGTRTSVKNTSLKSRSSLLAHGRERPAHQARGCRWGSAAR